MGHRNRQSRHHRSSSRSSRRYSLVSCQDCLPFSRKRYSDFVRRKCDRGQLQGTGWVDLETNFPPNRCWLIGSSFAFYSEAAGCWWIPGWRRIAQARVYRDHQCKKGWALKSEKQIVSCPEVVSIFHNSRRSFTRLEQCIRNMYSNVDKKSLTRKLFQYLFHVLRSSLGRRDIHEAVRTPGKTNLSTNLRLGARESRDFYVKGIWSYFITRWTAIRTDDTSKCLENHELTYMSLHFEIYEFTQKGIWLQQ